MVEGIVTRRKCYVRVIASHDSEGKVLPVSIEWTDGRVYQIDYVREARRATSLKVGGTGMRYLVTIGGRDTYLFYENPRWFVEEKVVEMP